MFGGGGGNGGGGSASGIGTAATAVHQIATAAPSGNAAAAQRMGMSFGIHSLLGLAAARDMQQGAAAAATYISSTPQYCTHQTAPFFPHNAPQLFAMEMPQTAIDRVQYEPMISQGIPFSFFLLQQRSDSVE